MRRPVNQPYTISTEFGVPDSNALFKRHSGVDYSVPTGTPVYAPVTGKVVYSQEHPVRGKMVVIFDGKLYHRLMHNSQLIAATGQQVSEGEKVALSGSTGLSTGPHVHWDINTRGVDAQSFADFINPADWLKGDNMPTISDAELKDLREWKEKALGLEKQRDTVLYPYINIISDALGVPHTADTKPALDAIARLKAADGGEYVKVTDLYARVK